MNVIEKSHNLLYKEEIIENSYKIAKLDNGGFGILISNKYIKDKLIFDGFESSAQCTNYLGNLGYVGNKYNVVVEMETIK